MLVAIIAKTNYYKHRRCGMVIRLSAHHTNAMRFCFFIRHHFYYKHAVPMGLKKFKT